jgi:hypothetical protein
MIIWKEWKMVSEMCAEATTICRESWSDDSAQKAQQQLQKVLCRQQRLRLEYLQCFGYL